MSGANRAIKAELASKGKGGDAVKGAFTPDKIRAETGRSLHTSRGVDSSKTSGDKDEYLGKNGKDATPTK